MMGTTLPLDRFKKQVLQHSLFPLCGLGAAIKHLGFIQADPIRCPARAQDLILRHRVKNYQAGDLEHTYPELELEEFFLYAYGFGSRELWDLIHPKTHQALTRAEQQTLKLIHQFGPMLPKDLAAHVGDTRSRNYWGGFSRTAKMTLESLHNRGALRIVGRKKGIRVYAAAEPLNQSLTKEERFQKIIIAALRSIGPTSQKFLLRELAHYHFLMPRAAMRRKHLQAMTDSGQVVTETVDAVEYISVANTTRKHLIPDKVRILAPFDPIVRDRTRFEHLWGWTYRFEAYTPQAKRKLGYYAMPVLWQEQIIGWANANVEGNTLKVDFGYVTRRPRGPNYRKAAEQEVADLAKFLKLSENDWEASF